MTPDPNITQAGSVDQLMTVLNAPPYKLGVPTAADFPAGTPLNALWQAPIAVSVTQDGAYRADIELNWRVILDLTTKTLSCRLTGLSPAAGRAGKE